MKPGRFVWTRWRTISLLGLLLATAIGISHGALSAQEPKRFVYKVIDVPGDTQALQNTLNEYGNAGWELVAVAIGDIQVPRLIFKK